jgi:hypothetical protein
MSPDRADNNNQLRCSKDAWLVRYHGAGKVSTRQALVFAC